MNTKIWLSPPHMSGMEEEYIREAFATNWIAPLGPNVDEFERALSRYLDDYHIARSSQDEKIPGDGAARCQSHHAFD